jgi:ketosteroid isomerase-like protein
MNEVEAVAETIEKRERCIRGYYETVDSWSFDRIGEYIAEDIVFRMDNAEPGQGLDVMSAITRQMPTVLASVEHDVVRIVQEPASGCAAVEVSVLLAHKDGRQLRVPAAIVMHFDESDLIDEYRAYTDTGDFFSSSDFFD